MGADAGAAVAMPVAVHEVPAAAVAAMEAARAPVALGPAHDGHSYRSTHRQPLRLLSHQRRSTQQHRQPIHYLDTDVGGRIVVAVDCGACLRWDAGVWGWDGEGAGGEVGADLVLHP